MMSNDDIKYEVMMTNSWMATLNTLFYNLS